MSFCESDGATDSQVSVNWWVMMSTDDTSLVIKASRDHLSPLLVPGSMDFLELVRVYPFAECFLVLCIIGLVKFCIPWMDDMFGSNVVGGRHSGGAYEESVLEDCYCHRQGILYYYHAYY